MYFDKKFNFDYDKKLNLIQKATDSLRKNTFVKFYILTCSVFKVFYLG